MTQKVIILISIIIGISNGLFSQTDSLQNNVFGGFITLPIEFPIIDNTQINNELNDLGFPNCDYPTANIGIGMQLYANRLIVMLSYNKTTNKNDNNNFSTEIEYRSTSLNVGYDLTKSYKYSIYPFIGFKGCGLNYLYREKISTEIDFQDYFQTSLEYKEITNSRANLDFGFGVSIQWFYLINFRAGYLMPLEEARWNINNNQDNLGNSPSLSYNYYFTLTIGVGGIASDNDIRNMYNIRDNN